ncbi:MAG: hypothetical protein DI585_00360 [Pseudomonas fluorescens]|nr:MAG: hypothetical protein DI585_00360 [Pseudomonas fluorescens]
MKDFRIADYKERLALAMDEAHPDAQHIQMLRWDMSMELMDELVTVNKDTPDTPPTHSMTLQVLDEAELTYALDHSDLLAVWHFARIQDTPLFAVVAELATCLWPQDADIQRAIGVVVDGITEELEETKDRQLASDAEAALRQVRAITTSEAQALWMLCAAHGIPPFPAANKDVRQ